MAARGEVVWTHDPFRDGGSNPRPWLVVANEALPYPDEECIAVALTTTSLHRGSIRVPEDAWTRGRPSDRGHVLPWCVATVKTDVHVVGTQGTLRPSFVERVVSALVAYLGRVE